MLKKTFITKIAALLKIDAAKLEAAIIDEKEADVEIPDDITVFTKPELTARDKNTYDTAKKAGEEMLIKELKKKHGVDVSGEDAEKFVEAVIKKAQADANANPDARIVELNTTIEATKKALIKANEKAEAAIAEKNTFQYNAELLSLLPTDRIDILGNDELLPVLNSKLKIETREGKKVVIKDGQPILDPKTMDPIAPADAIKGYFKERGWLKAEPGPGGGGRGGGNSSPGGKSRFTKLSEVNKYVTDSGLNPMGEAGMAAIQAAIKENPDIDMKN